MSRRLNQIEENARRNLGRLMEAEGMVQVVLAKKLRCSQPAISNWLSGETPLSLRRIEQLKRVFKVRSEEFFSRTKGPRGGANTPERNGE